MRHRTTVFLIVLGMNTWACESATKPTPRMPGSARFERSSNAIMHRVIGGGQLDVPALSTAKESYGFSAVVDAEGNAKGDMQIDFADTPPFHLDVTCLSVNGNDAWIGGVVTQTHDPNAVPVGQEMWVRVRDNGDGENGTPDQMGFFRFAPASFCLLQRPAPMPFNWLHGNISVR